MSSLRIVERGQPLPLRQRPAALAAVGVARLLARLPPRRIRAVLTLVRHRAAPATSPQALAAHNAVVATSVLCAGEGACNARSPPRCCAGSAVCGLPGAPAYVPLPSPPTPGSKSTVSRSANPTLPATTTPSSPSPHTKAEETFVAPFALFIMIIVYA